MPKGRLAEMFPGGTSSDVVVSDIYPDAVELVKEKHRREEEKIRANSGEVKTTVDFYALKKIAVKRPFSPVTPTLTITRYHIRLSSRAAEKIENAIENARVEIRANEHFIAVKQDDNGVQCRKEKGGGKRGLYVDRAEVVKQLLDLGWQVGMVIELHWDEDGQFWWGRKPKGADK